MNKLTKKELERIQELVNSFNKLKISLGDTVIQQNSLMSEISEMKAEYALEEQKLMKKYGEDAVINIQTGEIKKENG
jgi:allophanate hydrolase subunit 1|tara:strand:- start:930 stop:1160 length:231 start_codon:yes stop_codon:yes gene_type:complete